MCSPAEKAMDGVGDRGWGGTHQTFNGEALECYKVSGHRNTGQPHCSALRDTVGYIRNDHAKSRQLGAGIAQWLERRTRD